jgi:hypothetical protein
MNSLFHAIEERVRQLGGEKVKIRQHGDGTSQLIVAWIKDGEPFAALMKTPGNRERKKGLFTVAIEKALQ